MSLEVAHQVLRLPGGLGDALGVQTEAGEGLTQGDALGVGLVPPGLLPFAGHGPGAQQRGAEPGALLIGVGGDLQGEGQLLAGLLGALLDPAGDLDGQQHAQDAVVAAGVGDCVQMGGEHQGREAVLAAFQACALVAGGVLPGGQAHLGHPCGGQGVVLGVLRGEVGAQDAGGLAGVVGEGCDPGQLITAVHDALGCGHRGLGGLVGHHAVTSFW